MFNRTSHLIIPVETANESTQTIDPSPAKSSCIKAIKIMGDQFSAWVFGSQTTCAIETATNNIAEFSDIKYVFKLADDYTYGIFSCAMAGVNGRVYSPLDSGLPTLAKIACHFVAAGATAYLVSHLTFSQDDYIQSEQRAILKTTLTATGSFLLENATKIGLCLFGKPRREKINNEPGFIKESLSDPEIPLLIKRV